MLRAYARPRRALVLTSICYDRLTQKRRNRDHPISRSSGFGARSCIRLRFELDLDPYRRPREAGHLVLWGEPGRKSDYARRRGGKPQPEDLVAPVRRKAETPPSIERSGRAEWRARACRFGDGEPLWISHFVPNAGKRAALQKDHAALPRGSESSNQHFGEGVASLRFVDAGTAFFEPAGPVRAPADA
jgi:hypothetical protein